MNKTELITEVAKVSGVNIEDCRKVLDAFEKVTEKKLSDGIGNGIDQVCNLVNFFSTKNKKQ